MHVFQSFITSFIIFFSSLFFHVSATPAQNTLVLPTATPIASASATPPQTQTPAPTHKSVITVTPKPTGIVQGAHTTTTATPVTSQQYTGSSALLDAMNSFRKSKGLGTLASNSDLCRIAQTRANDQQNAGHLDHSNFQTQAHTQNTFHHVGEILQYWSEPKSADFLVNTGWATSGEHLAVMSDPAYTHGCGGIAGLYSVFIFGN